MNTQETIEAIMTAVSDVADNGNPIARTASAEAIGRVHTMLTQAFAEIKSKHDSELLEEIRNRDRYHEKADDLASAISKHFRVDIGEHSNANCPWDVALEVMEGGYVTDSDADRLRVLLAGVYCPLLYADDGELQDNRVAPFIDFKRDSVDEIAEKMKQRTIAAQDQHPDDLVVDHIVKRKMEILAQQGMRPCGAIMIDAQGNRATIDMGRVTWDAPAKIVAYLHENGIDAVTVEKKASMENHSGVPGKQIAALYSIPLYANAAVPAFEPPQELQHVKVDNGERLCLWLERRNDQSRYGNLFNEIAAHIRWLRGQIAASVGATCYSNDNGETWHDSCEDVVFVGDLDTGDEYELLASTRPQTELFRVVKAPDDVDGDYVVERVVAPSIAHQEPTPAAEAVQSPSTTQVNESALRDLDALWAFAEAIEWAYMSGNFSAEAKTEAINVALENLANSGVSPNNGEPRPTYQNTEAGSAGQ
jgi:hypothetical protein